MNDPAKNPYVSGNTSSGGSLPIGQGMNSIDASVTTGALISLALIGGLITVSGIMAFLMLSGDNEEQSLFRWDGDAVIFLGIGYLVFFASAIAGWVLRQTMMKRATQDLRSAKAKLPRPLQGDSALPPAAQRYLALGATSRLISQAMLEGPAMLNAVLMFVDSNFAHAVPIALAVIGIALQFPTTGKTMAAIEDAAA